MLILLVAATMFSSPAEPTPTGTPRYFFVLFGGQSVPFRPRTAHTFATFVRTTPTSDGTMAVESFTISWLPETGEVKPWKLRAEKGRNFTLEQTFAQAEANSARVSMWGPYEIDAEWYAKASAQSQRLESGEVRYRVIDSFGLNGSVEHCVHAVTLADTTRQWRLQPVLRVGEPGTSRLAAEYLRKGAFIGAATTHDWLIPAVGLDRFPVIRRQPGEIIRRDWR